jgi:hypothetical protein
MAGLVLAELYTGNHVVFLYMMSVADSALDYVGQLKQREMFVHDEQVMQPVVINFSSRLIEIFCWSQSRPSTVSSNYQVPVWFASWHVLVCMVSRVHGIYYIREFHYQCVRVTSYVINSRVMCYSVGSDLTSMWHIVGIYYASKRNEYTMIEITNVRSSPMQSMILA